MKMTKKSINLKESGARETHGFLGEIYQPSHDSYFFQEFLKKYLTTNCNPQTTKYLDMGTGSGILAKTALEFLNPKNITASDINPIAIKNLKKEKFKIIQSNLFQAFSRDPIKLDLITFNAPYLPLDTREPKSSQLTTTGGRRGDEISLKFLKQAKKHLSPGGKVFLLISSLTPTNKIKKVWSYKIVARKKLFMEELFILEFSSQ
jgi:release factor glutamine methyltransferase